MSNVKDFLKRKDIVITPQRYLIEALGAMAQGLFASLLIGTIIKTLGQQTGLGVLVDLGGYATAMSGPAMACAIGWALHCPPLVLFSLITVGYSANALGGAGGPLAVLIIAIVASELGKAVSKETRVDILVTPLVTIFSGVGLSMLIAAPIGAAASQSSSRSASSARKREESCRPICSMAILMLSSSWRRRRYTAPTQTASRSSNGMSTYIIQETSLQRSKIGRQYSRLSLL